MYLLENLDNEKLFLETDEELKKIYKAFEYLMNGNEIKEVEFDIPKMKDVFENHEFRLTEVKRFNIFKDQMFSKLNVELRCDELDICIMYNEGMFLYEADKRSIEHYGVYFNIIMFIDSDDNFRTTNEYIEEFEFDYNGQAFFYELSSRENYIRLELLKYLKWNDSNGDFIDSLEEKPLTLNHVLEILERQETEDLAEHPSYILDLIKEVSN